MKKKDLQKLIRAKMSLRKIADRVGKSPTTVRYWLLKHGLKPAFNVHEGGWRIRPVRPCSLCGKMTGRGHLCSSCWVKVRRYRLKLAIVKHLGNECVTCGWTGHPAGFVCHHRGKGKDFTISHNTSKSWETIKKELKKCVLMCGRCHLIEHAADQSVIDEARKYDGMYPI